jgi:hypothetical protein
VATQKRGGGKEVTGQTVAILRDKADESELELLRTMQYARLAAAQELKAREMFTVARINYLAAVQAQRKGAGL